MPFDNPYQLPFGDIEVLRSARASIASKGSWLQGGYMDGHRRCLVAALSLASNSRNYRMPNRTERRIARLMAGQLLSTTPIWLRLRIMPARQRLIWFNDYHQTRQEDVVALFDRAIDSLASSVEVRVHA